MSYRRGWKRTEFADYAKEIDGRLYEIVKYGQGHYWLYLERKPLGLGNRLADAKCAAHRHAEEAK